MNSETSKAINGLRDAIMPFAAPYSDCEIGAVGCVVEGQIAIVKGLFAIAAAINRIAEAQEEQQSGGDYL